jgi:acyl-CoA synthetase (AMP-forming)/AMP-acid ligase II
LLYAHFAEAILHNVTEHGSKTAITFLSDFDADDGRISLTYEELDRKARAVSAALLTRCSPGDRALLLYPEGVDFTTAFVGCLYAGVVAVPSPLPGRYQHHQRRVTAIATDAQVSVVLTDSRSLPDVGAWAEAAGREREDVLVTDLLDTPPLEVAELPALDRETLALLQYTSGSTGDPKGVVLTHGNLLHNADSLGRTFNFDHTARFGSWIPHYHDMGLMGIILPPLALGGSCVLMSPASFIKRPHWWLRMIDEFDITFSAGPNFAYELCSRKVTDEQLATLDLSRWKYACNGSEPVQAATLTAFGKRFAPAGLRAETLTPSYGMAEATVFVCSSVRREPVLRRFDEAQLSDGALLPVDAPQAGRELVSCGLPTDFDLRIADPVTGAAVPAGTVGEIWLRGPSIGRGYWKKKQATEQIFHADGGFLRTGDLGAVLDDELFVTGRIKEMLILRGRNLYPQDIEYEVRSLHPQLQSLFGAAFTVPVQDEDGLEEELLVLVHELRGKPGEEELEQLSASIRRSVFTEFGAHLAGLVLVRRGTVPRTTSGKIQRLQTRDMFRTRALQPLFAKLDRKLEQAVS